MWPKYSEITPEMRFNDNAARLISYGLVTAMLVCASLTMVNFVIALGIHRPPWYLAWLVALTTLERLYMYRRSSRVSLFGKDWLVVNGSQWVILLIIIKLTIGLSMGADAFLAEIPKWRVDFATYFLTPEVFFAILVVGAVWLIAGAYADMLDNIGLDASILKHELPVYDAGEQPARERLINLIFGTGIVLVLLTAMMRMNLREVFFSDGKLTFSQIPLLENGGASTLLYFMFAMALLSQSQFINLHALWSIQRIPVNREVSGRWALYTFIFLLLIAGITTLLPTSYSLGVLTVLGYLLSVLLAFILFIEQMVVGFVLFLFSLPLLLIGARPSAPKAPVIRMPKPEIPTDAGTNLAWWEASKTAIFWALLAGILLFALITYLRQHEEILDELKKVRGLGWLAKIWSWLTSLFGKVSSGIEQVVEAGRKRLRSRRSNSADWFNAGFLNLRRLDPRQRVYFFYLAFLRRSDESGLPRRLSQTPSEFAAHLDSALPAAEPDIDALTAAFIEARYTPKPVEPEKANVVKEYWERLKKALRNKKVGHV